MSAPRRVVVDSRLRVYGLRFDEVEALEHAFSHSNPGFYKAKSMGFKPYSEPPVIKTFRHEGDGALTLPRGGWSRLVEVSRRMGFAISQESRRTERALDRALEPAIEPRWYQDEAVRAAIAAQQGVIKAPTAAGKTIVGLLIAARTKQRSLFVVADKGLFSQWIEAVDFVFPGLKPGVVKSGKMRPAPITVAMQQTLARAKPEALKSLLDEFGCIVCDEVQKASAPTFMRVFDQAPALYRIGVSADQRRTDRKEFLLHDVFGEVIYEVPKKVIVEEGHIIEPSVLLVPTNFEAEWYKQAKLEGRTPSFPRLEEEMSLDDARNMLGVEVAAESHQQGRSVLLLCSRRDWAAVLRAMLRSLGVEAALMIGGERDFEANRVALGNGSLRAAVGTTDAAGTGLDMPALEDAVLFAPVLSRQPENQIKGRLCRTSKGSQKIEARLFELYDVKVFGLDYAKKRRAWHSSCSVVDRLTGSMISVPVKPWIAERVRSAEEMGDDGNTTTDPAAAAR